MGSGIEPMISRDLDLKKKTGNVDPIGLKYESFCLDLDLLNTLNRIFSIGG